MKTISATEARKRFAGLRADLREPVRIERHGKAVAYLLPPDPPPADPTLAARREARLQQQLVERDRYVRHLKVALNLLGLSPAHASARVNQARDEVGRWEREHLCSTDYIQRWRHLLALPIPILAARISGDLDGWGPALRQNSPFY